MYKLKHTLVLFAAKVKLSRGLNVRTRKRRLEKIVDARGEERGRIIAGLFLTSEKAWEPWQCSSTKKMLVQYMSVTGVDFKIVSFCFSFKKQVYTSM